MTNRNTRANIGRSLMLVMGLLLSACDGGIFGTGGPDDINMSTVDASVPVDGQIDDTGGTAASNSEGDTGTTTTEASDAGSTGNAAGTTDAGNTSGLTDGEAPNQGIADAGSTDGGAGSDVPFSGTSEFINNQATLDTADVRINLINNSSITVNAIESSVANSTVLFGDGGVAFNRLSNTATLQQNNTSIDIVDNDTPAEKLFSFTSFNSADATFTTLLVRQNGEQIDTIPLVTLTKTSDPTLAKVRVVHADALNNGTAEAFFQLRSAGANPGGIDQGFGPLSYATPASNYTDIPNGDYVFFDPLSQIDSQRLFFVGGNVYTIVVWSNGAEPLLLIDDTEGGN